MNKHLYRIVFNRALGLFQVVAEIARRDGPGAGAGSRFLPRSSPCAWPWRLRSVRPSSSRSPTARSWPIPARPATNARPYCKRPTAFRW